PRPRVRPEPGHRLRAQLCLPTVPAVESLEKERCEGGDLFPSLPQRRDRNLDHVETAEFLPEVVTVSGPDALDGGSDGAHVTPDQQERSGGRALSDHHEIEDPGGRQNSRSIVGRRLHKRYRHHARDRQAPLAQARLNRANQSSSSSGRQPSPIHFRAVTVVPLPNSERISNSSMRRRTPGRPSPRLPEVEKPSSMASATSRIPGPASAARTSTPRLS